MNFTTIMGFVAGALQFVVAGYALRLNRLFGTRRVGWSLFWAFLLLALLHLMQSIMHGGLAPEMGVKVDVMNVLISMLLLIGMIHLEALLKERKRAELEEQRLRIELQEEIKRKTDYLSRAIEQLQSEMDHSKKMENEAQTVRWELSAVSRRAEMAQIASTVLHSVGETINSVNTSTKMVSDQMKHSKIANIVRIGVLIREHGTGLAAFMTQDPRGQKLPEYIAELAEHLSMEQCALLTQLETIKENLEKIASMQHNYTKLVGQADTIKVSDAVHGSENFVAA